MRCCHVEKHIGPASACLPCLQHDASWHTTPWQGKKRINSLTKCSLLHTFMCLYGQVGCYCPTKCAPAVRLRSLRCGWSVYCKLNDAYSPCSVCSTQCSCLLLYVVSFAIRSLCSIHDANKTQSKDVLLSGIIYQILFYRVILKGQRRVVLKIKHLYV